MKNIFFVFLALSSFPSWGQAGSEIYLFDMTIDKGSITLTNGTNITNHKGYDNQPFFHPSKPILYYASFDDSSRSDIKSYNYQTKTTKALTITREREYSPTVTPDEKYLSCIIQRDDGSQDLGKYPIEGGTPEVLINDLKVGYHAWASPSKLLLFVLTDTVTNTLHFYDLVTKKHLILAKNPGRSLHRIPGQNAMSFIQKKDSADWMIHKLDLSSYLVSPITVTLPKQENLTWLKDNTIVMSDGKEIFSFHVGVDNDWKLVNLGGDVSRYKGISRLATNADNSKLAIVVTE